MDFLPFRAHLNAQSGRKSTLIFHAGDYPRSFRAEGVACDLAFLQLLEHSGATGEHVAVGGIEIAGVPGIGDIAIAAGKAQKLD